MQLDTLKLSLVGVAEELPYELGEMPQVHSALEPFGQLGFLESREGTEKYEKIRRKTKMLSTLKDFSTT